MLENITKITTEKITALAPADKLMINWEDRIRREDIKKYWMETIKTEVLQDDETVRLTAILPYKDSNGNLMKSQITLKDQVRSADELINTMDLKYQGIKENDWKALVGWSMSCATYEYVTNDDGKPVAPGRDSFRTINTIVIDMDSHTKKNSEDKSSERFNFNSFDEPSRRICAAIALTKLNSLFEKEGMDLELKASKAYATGGGLQFTFNLDKPLIKTEADKVLGYVKHALNTFKDDRFVAFGTKFDKEFDFCYFDFDVSSTDITHTQRVCGTINPKENYYGAFAEEIVDLYNMDLMEQAVTLIRDSVNKTETALEYQKSVKNLISNTIIGFKKIIKQDDYIVYKTVSSYAFMLKHTNETYRKGDKNTWGSAQDFEILQQITPKQQSDYMSKELTILKEQSTTRYSAYICPIHDDKNASFVIYHNPDRPVAYAKDFHDDAIYNCITFLMKTKDISHNDALHMVASDNNVQLKSNQRKSIVKEDDAKDVDELINKIDTENFIYYRLANKSRACIVREFTEGLSFTFDGTKMLSDHILLNQLNVKQAGLELRIIFHDKFVEKVLINAFEEFKPGAGYTFEKKFIKYVNLWIPGKDYLKIHELAETMNVMEIPQAIAIIKDRLPSMYFYLCQMTQKGSLEYFVNWLINLAKFQTMSTIPVVTSVQGTGKGVFVEYVLEYYLNHEYVNTVKSEKMSSNFNSFMEKSSLIVLDEGDFSRSHEVDNLKLLSGNPYIQIEKKGVDSQKMKKQFNIIMMTNGETPAVHPSNDRRFTYFRCDVTLLDAIQPLGYEFIDDFIESLKFEVQEFWAILVKTNPKKEWSQMNLKDNQFNKQILLMHPFGKLVLKMIDNEWDEIKLQINEDVSDGLVITSNLEMVNLIRKEFETKGTIDLTLVNKYIKSLPFKSFISVQQFIKINALHKNGIKISTDATSVKLNIDKTKLKTLIRMDNNLGKLFDIYSNDKIEYTLSQASTGGVAEEAEIQADLLLNSGLQPIDSSDPLGLNPIQHSTIMPPPPSSIMV